MERITENDPKVIEKAVDILKDGGIIIYPTETCYGLGVDATNAGAVRKLYRYKSRREGKPLSIAVLDIEMASKYAVINETAQNLYENYLPGPVTVVSSGLGRLAPGVESEYGTIGIRIPDYPLILKIVEKLGRPITATSANVSYQARPYNIDTLLKFLPQKQKELIDLIIDAGKLPKREVSTVVDTTMNDLNILRDGRVAFEKKGKSVLSATTSTPEETISFGAMVTLKYIDTLVDSCLVLALGGELGTGKTQFTKGVAKQLGISKIIKSPTFNLVHEYDYKLGEKKGKLVHIDTWRLGDKLELKGISITEFIKPGNIVVIEWADKFYDSLMKEIEKSDAKVLRVSFTHVDPKTRRIEVFA